MILSWDTYEDHGENAYLSRKVGWGDPRRLKDLGPQRKHTLCLHKARKQESKKEPHTFIITFKHRTSAGTR